MSEPEDDRKPGEERVRYVHVSDPSLSAWPEMVKTVMEADKAKVKDCTKDIDTLLVFAGLYSAVLTAFLIESYKALQQDKQDVMIGLLQQIAVKSFVSGPGFLNSTVKMPLPLLPPFEPPLWAIRVNVLWFIGLILSLAAASLGIFVKQWLQEYLAYEYAAPRERLRARQYRTPALSQWGLFEIAALLPLLLQISLGLFFLGLCIFTSAVHATVGYTTLPLVAAWVFLIFLTTIAPLFSPRCPYKTRFLKPALKAGRRIVAPTSRRLASTLLQYAQSLGRRLKASSFLQHAQSLGRQSKASIMHWWARLLRYTEQPSQHLESTPESNEPKPNVPDVLLEEEDVVKGDQDDVEILLSADAFISDDGLLPTMLGVLLQQAGSDPTSVVKFALEITRRRVGETLPTEHLTFVPDLQALSRHTWVTLTDGIAKALADSGSGPLTSNTPGSVVDAVIFLLSRSGYELSYLAARTLQSFLAPDTKNLCTSGTILGKRLAGDGNGSPRCPELSHGPFVVTLAKVQDTPICLTCIMDVYTPFLCQDPRHHHASLNHLLAAHQLEWQESVPRSQEVLCDMLDLFLLTLSRAATDKKLWDSSRGVWEASYITLQYGTMLGRPRHAASLCRQILVAPFLSIHALVWYAAVDSRVRVKSDSELADAFMSANSKEKSDIIHNLTMVLDQYCAGQFDGSDWDPFDLVRVCRLCLHVYLKVSRSETSSPEDRIPWKKLWNSLSKATKRYYEKEVWKEDFRQYYWYLDTPPMAIDNRLAEDKRLACECLDISSPHPNPTTTAHSTDIADASAALVGPLLLFVPPDHIQEMLNRFLPPPLLPARISTPPAACTSTLDADERGSLVPAVILRPPDADELADPLSMILDALQQPAERTLSCLMTVVLHVAGQRVEQTLPTKHLTFIPDLQTLSERVWAALTDSVANALAGYGNGPLTSDTPDSVIDAVIFLLSRSSYELSESAASILLRFLAPETPDHPHGGGWTISERLVAGGESPRYPGLSQGFLATNIQKLRDTPVCLLCIMGMYVRVLCRDPQHNHGSLTHLLDTHLSESPEFVASLRDALADALDFLMQFLSWTITAKKSWNNYLGAHEASYIILQYGATLGRPQYAISLYPQMLRTPARFIATTFFAAIDPRVRVKPDREYIFVDAFMSANTQQRIDILRGSILVLQEYCTGAYDGRNYDRIDLVRLCRLWLRIYLEAPLAIECSNPEDSRPWGTLWGILSRSIRRYHEKETWKEDFLEVNWSPDVPQPAIDDRLAEDRVLACECLDLLAMHFNSITTTSSIDVKDTSAALIKPLWLFVPEERMQDYEPLRRFLPLPLPLPPSPLPTTPPPPALSPIPEADDERNGIEPDGADKADEEPGNVDRAGKESGATNKAAARD